MKDSERAERREMETDSELDLAIIHLEDIISEFEGEIESLKVTEEAIEPSHYTDMTISPLEYIEANEHLTWSLSNAIKYISRVGKKENNPILQDLKKAQWYLNHEIERLEKEVSK